MNKYVLGLMLTVAVLAAGAGAAYATLTPTSSLVPTITINTPSGPLLTLKTSELAALPQQTVTVSINGTPTTEQGPSLSALLTFAGVQYSSACKNDELRYWIQATDAKAEAVTLTAGELDPGFGNRPAILSISENGKFLTSKGARLVVPNDSGARDLQSIRVITVGRAPAQIADPPSCATSGAVSTPPVGSLMINGDVSSPTTYTFAQLQAMPQASQTVSFLSGTTPTTLSETGPSIWSLVLAAKPKFLACDKNDELRFVVEVTSSQDGYAALMSLAELDPTLNNTMSLASLVENGASQASQGPRSTVPGDVKGGRYVSGAAVITVLRPPTELHIPSCQKSK
ncbi:MAG TPA: hypothetical protein VH063_01535 [Gaiellaceae bacterium]|jgi:hypothetical protein|nr:hypothetical protein [Gaiellaceae bacterium]